MRAFLLAAGLGTRLRPLTDTIPKCLVPIQGRPLLSYWIELLEHHGFSDVLINLHHLPHQVRAYLAHVPSRLRFTTFEEPTLLGSAGTVRANRAWVQNEHSFLIAYADNLTTANLGALVGAHDTDGPLLTVGLFATDEPRRAGIAEVAADGLIVSFVEKPESPLGDLANAGIYVADHRLFDHLPAVTPCDFGRHVLPALVGRMRAHRLHAPLIDVGTPESYQQAQSRVHEFTLSERQS